MSAHSTNIVQTNTDEVRWLLRPVYYILRPGNRLVPLIAGDELPNWLKIVGSYYVDVTKIVTVNKGDPYPRNGEYDIICQYCVDATEHVLRNDERRYDVDVSQEEQGIDALRERGYAPTGQNQYAQRVPAASEAPVKQLRQPVQVPQSSQISPSSRISLSPQISQPAQVPQPAQTRPPALLPHISSLSPLPSLPSLPSQPSGLNPQSLQQAVQQAIQLQSPQQPHQQQLQYTKQQMYLPQQLSQQQQTCLPQQPYQQQQLNWWQDRGRTRDRDQLRYHPWDYKSPPGQPRRRLLPVAEPHLRSRSPFVNVNVRQGEDSRGLNATAPAFVPSAASAASVDGSAAFINR